jgi:hypothetical protein
MTGCGVLPWPAWWIAHPRGHLVTIVRTCTLRAAFSVALAMGLAGLQNRGGALAQSAGRAGGQANNAITEKAKHYMEMASSSQKVRAYIANHTRMTSDQGHGTQVEYNAPDGMSYLWYPGNRVAVLGRWKVEEGLAPDQVHHFVHLCYLYSVLTYDPVDNSRGGKWECIPAWYAMIRTKERIPGNPFRLGNSVKIPFILSPQETNLAKLLAQARR